MSFFEQFHLIAHVDKAEGEDGSWCCIFDGKIKPSAVGGFGICPNPKEILCLDGFTVFGSFS